MLYHAELSVRSVSGAKVGRDTRKPKSLQVLQNSRIGNASENDYIRMMHNRRDKKHNPYKQANEAFLEVKAKEEGMVVLDNGVLYKVLETGRGTKKPTPRSIVYVHYTGRLIDGTVFDTTDGDQLPALFMVGDLIMGWQIALTRMHEGDKWEVYIPAKWGYGAMKMDDIPAHSTLIFTLELVKIER